LTDFKGQLLHALCNRKPFPKDIAVSPTISDPPNLATLLHIVSGVAPLLEAVDKAVILAPGEVDIDILFERLFVLESQLNDWLREHVQQQQHPATGTSNTETTPPSPPPSLHTKTTVFNLTCESLCRISLLLTSESLADLSLYHPRRASATATIPIPSPEVAAASLCHTATLLISAAKTPINRARVVSGPLHFLQGFFARRGDEVGLRWCAELKGRVCGVEGAGFLRWDALLPWCLLDFHRRSEVC
jgi:hypothetical protein